MDMFEPYDPEDMEALLKDKSFEELLPEEQAFVLKHIATKEEYDSLRSLYFKLHEQRLAAIEPSARLTDKVMADFRAKHAVHKTDSPWWKWFFSITPWFSLRNPGIRLAIATLLLLIAGLPFLLENDKHELLAENKTELQEPVLPSPAEDTTKPNVSPEEVPLSTAEVEDPVQEYPESNTRTESLAENSVINQTEIEANTIISDNDAIVFEKETKAYTSELHPTANRVEHAAEDQSESKKDITTNLFSLPETNKGNRAKSDAVIVSQKEARNAEMITENPNVSSAKRFESVLKKCFTTR